ncbi:hypothetical protein NL459_27985, partial [Klebsiella pneumoniae]|nr:hypothetical protein [Klebsiella pneumoniae]
MQDARLLGEHFFNLRLLAQYAQQQAASAAQAGNDAGVSPSIFLDLVKHGRIVLRRKGAPMRSEPGNLNANGAAQFQLQVLN